MRGLTPAAGQHSLRIASVDLLRGWAVIVMVQTHVFHATLLPSFRASASYSVVEFLDGLVAPSFLFASGMAYAISTRRKINDYLNFGWPLFHQLGRLLFILVVGYLLHIPKFNYHHLVAEAGPQAWKVFWQVDILQCIAASLLLLQVLLMLLRSERRLYQILPIVLLGVLSLTPVMWGIDWRSSLPLPLAAYLNGMSSSLFPLFPWSAFLFAGALIGRALNEARVRGTAPEEDRLRRTLALSACGLVAASFLLHPLESRLYPVYDYWKFSPSFVILRLGLVLLLYTALSLYERRRGVSARSAVALFGRESFLAYVTHLMLIYEDFGNGSWMAYVGSSFGPTLALASTLILLLLVYGEVFAWERIKRGSPQIKRGLQLAVLGGFALVFFFFPLSR